MTELDVRLDETGSLPAEPVRDDTQLSSAGASTAAQDEHMPAPGAVVGNYRLLEVIGTGGMGRVYKAEHKLLGKKVALKMLRRRYAENPDAVQRFFSEARAVTSIEHENLVDVTDFIDSPEWPPCFVMQLLRGRSLAKAIREDGPFPVPRLLGVAAQTASAVAAVHEASIIHRDLKPANIFLAQHRGGGEVVKLLDFGVAKLLDEHGVSMHDTNAGVPVGTPDYMAPEQVTGNARIDFRVDIWALGAVMYEAATGRLPFKAASFGELVLALVTRDVVPPNELRAGHEPLPKSLELLILQCLSRVAAQRPSSMQEVHERLLALAAPYGVPFLDGGPLLLAETDPGASQRSSESGPHRRSNDASEKVPLADARHLPVEEPSLEDPPSSDRETGEIPEAVRRPPSTTWKLSLVAAGVAVAVVGAVWSLGSADEPAKQTQAVEASVNDHTGDESAESAPSVGDESDVRVPEAGEVTISFVSTPRGAKVFRAGESEPLGTAPFELSLPRGEELVRFDVRLDGHVPAVAEVKPDRAQVVQSSLAPVSVSAPEERPRKQRPRRQPVQERPARVGDKAGLIDVF